MSPCPLSPCSLALPPLSSLLLSPCFSVRAPQPVLLSPRPSIVPSSLCPGLFSPEPSPLRPLQSFLPGPLLLNLATHPVLPNPCYSAIALQFLPPLSPFLLSPCSSGVLATQCVLPSPLLSSPRPSVLAPQPLPLGHPPPPPLPRLLVPQFSSAYAAGTCSPLPSLSSLCSSILIPQPLPPDPAPSVLALQPVLLSPCCSSGIAPPRPLFFGPRSSALVPVSPVLPGPFPRHSSKPRSLYFSLLDPQCSVFRPYCPVLAPY